MRCYTERILLIAQVFLMESPAVQQLYEGSAWDSLFRLRFLKRQFQFSLASWRRRFVAPRSASFQRSAGCQLHPLLVIRKPRSKYRFARFRDLNGRERRQSSKQTDRKKALKIAESTAKFLEFLGPSAELDMALVTRPMIVEFRNQVARKASATTTNHDLKAIKLIFRSAKRDGSKTGCFKTTISGFKTFIERTRTSFRSET
jgi:hypothetical protein